VIEGIRFTKEHEWIIIREGLAVMGISDFAQRQVGDIVSIELPRVAVDSDTWRQWLLLIL